jgi:hypothetical protein
MDHRHTEVGEPSAEEEAAEEAHQHERQAQQGSGKGRRQECPEYDPLKDFKNKHTCEMSLVCDHHFFSKNGGTVEAASS